MGTTGRLCGPGPSAFFSDEPAVIAQAKVLCATCPMRHDCLELGLAERFGVWGGLTVEERRAHGKPRRSAAWAGCPVGRATIRRA